MDDKLTADRAPWIPKPRVAKRYDTTSRTVDRWREDPDLGFPQPIDINGYLYFSEPELIAWERKRAAGAASARAAKGIVRQRREQAGAESGVNLAVPATP